MTLNLIPAFSLLQLLAGGRSQLRRCCCCGWLRLLFQIQHTQASCARRAQLLPRERVCSRLCWTQALSLRWVQSPSPTLTNLLHNKCRTRRHLSMLMLNTLFLRRSCLLVREPDMHWRMLDYRERRLRQRWLLRVVQLLCL